MLGVLGAQEAFSAGQYTALLQVCECVCVCVLCVVCVCVACCELALCVYFCKCSSKLAHHAQCDTWHVLLVMDHTGAAILLTQCVRVSHHAVSFA
jgi:hypothetical protein